MKFIMKILKGIWNWIENLPDAEPFPPGRADVPTLDLISIQAQDLDDGIWRTYLHTGNDPQRIIVEMRNVAEFLPGRRVRAVDEFDRVVDILT